jgi:hypothetical protein
MPRAHQATRLAKRSGTFSLRAFLVSPRSFTPAYSSAHTHRFLVQPQLRVHQRVARPCSALCGRSRKPNHGLPSLRTGRSDAQWTILRRRPRKTCPGARKQPTIYLKKCLVKRPPLMEERQRVGVCGLRRRSPLRCVRRGYGLGVSTNGTDCGRRPSSTGMYCI